LTNCSFLVCFFCMFFTMHNTSVGGCTTQMHVLYYHRAMFALRVVASVLPHTQWSLSRPRRHVPTTGITRQPPPQFWAASTTPCLPAPRPAKEMCRGSGGESVGELECDAHTHTLCHAAAVMRQDIL
jgi:hypothetical protein